MTYNQVIIGNKLGNIKDDVNGKKGLLKKIAELELMLNKELRLKNMTFDQVIIESKLDSIKYDVDDLLKKIVELELMLDKEFKKENNTENEKEENTY